jgi:putative transposase
VSPAHRKRMVEAALAAGLCSGRKACRMMKLARSTLRYRAGVRSDARTLIVKRMHELSEANPRYGYRRITALLRREGWLVGKRQIRRLRRQEGLRVPPSKKKVVRRGTSTGWPTKADHRGHVWTWDFIADSTVRGGALRMLTVLDEHTRECHVLRPERAIKAGDVVRLVKAAVEKHGAPEFIRSDNGPEFIAKDLQAWLAEEKIKTIYIEPGSPWENGFVESFHGRFRDECLNREQLWTLTEARVVIEDFRVDYNVRRPHSGLDYRTPQECARGLPLAVTTAGGLRPPFVVTAKGSLNKSSTKQPLD